MLSVVQKEILGEIAQEKTTLGIHLQVKLKAVWQVHLLQTSLETKPPNM